MMDAELIKLMMVQSSLVDRLFVLAQEYKEKAISSDRFAERVYGMLISFDKESK